MKKTIILLLSFMLSCVNHTTKNDVYALEDSELMEYEMKANNFTLEKLASEKLQNYFELLKLKKEHPEFKEDIVLRLKEFSKQELVKMDDLDSFYVKNIRKAETALKLSDSVQKLKLYYDITLGNRNKTDSLNALITSKKIMLDGIETKSIVIKFASFN